MKKAREVTVWENNGLIEELIAYCESENFQAMIEIFKLDNAHLFEEYLDAKSIHNVTHKIESTEIFENYKLLLDQLLHDFCRNHATNTRDLFMECLDIYEGRFCPLFQDHEHKWFIDTMLAWNEYELFFDEMIDVARKSCGRSKK